MPNSINFDSIPIEVQNFDTILNNQINLDSTIPNNLYNYDIVAPGFVSSITSRTDFRQYNTITLSGYSFGNNTSASIIIEPTIISASFGGILLKTIMTGSFLQYNTINATPLLNQIAGSALFIQNNNITVNPSIYINISNIFISTGSVTISASPIQQKYYVLNDWSGSTLSQLDSMTLQQMDYQIV